MAVHLEPLAGKAGDVATGAVFKMQLYAKGPRLVENFHLVVLWGEVVREKAGGVIGSGWV